jgi:hypothetical protein
VKTISWLLKYRYFLLSGLVFALMCLSVSKQYWVGDFWEHAAVIRELAAHPLHPGHPIIAVNAPHALYSPYALFWGIFSRLTGFNPIKTLSIAGIINCFLFLVGLYLFISALVPEERDGAAFYSLLFMLLLWGTYAWNFSGFFHLRQLGYILPYPSTFCMALVFIALAMNIQRVESNRDAWLLPILILSTIVLLSHQITFIFLAVGILATSLRSRRGLLSELLRVAGLFLVALLLASLWPYYPLMRLMFGASAVYDTSQMELYRSILIRVWPALVGIPLLVLDLRGDWRKPLPWMFVILLGIYILGDLSTSYSYGRVVSFMIYILDFTLAIYLVRLEHWVQVKVPRIPGLPLLLCASITLGLAALAFNPFIYPALERSILSERRSYEDYYFLSKYVKDNEVVLTDPTGNLVPVFGGKLVGAATDLPFVPDAQARLDAVNRFFNPDTPPAEKLKVIQDYRVTFVLLQKSRAYDWRALRDFMKSYGQTVYENRRFILLRTH